MNRYTQIREEIHDAVMRGIDFSRSVEDGEVLELIDDEIVRAKREGSLSLDEMKRMRQELFNAIRRLDILQDLIEDPKALLHSVSKILSIYATLREKSTLIAECFFSFCSL